ncbi:MBL fold metallo-hydrolase [Nesterenkonia lacusekhoensis]|uniref:Ribonuclease BN (tRNA processing enzyme) n=1 Tax=Nesterenkonia lacusekhoensis TaxID=150832 RepID=A0ABS4T4C6_9MICC|nr:MBL fold metallo-hydrolase [Nesterenkonia lacusekhoensis]MBP2318728.1 ribonuclease BN (tRNA processing enzyme) [Nesterenkonia lacusekhoensis]
MTLTVEILGSNATAPSAAGPASGYLLRTEAGMVLVDAGPGVMAEYVSRHSLSDLRAIVVTHLHADHSLDLMAFAYRWTFPERLPRIPLYLPEEDLPRLRAFDAVFGIDTLPGMESPTHAAWDVRGLRLDGSAEEGWEELGLQLRSYRAHHPVPAACLRFSSVAEEAVVAFSGDTGHCEGLLQAAQDADVFICEATYLKADPQATDGHGHLTARMAGEAAAQAGAGHLVLSHFGLDEMRAVAGEHVAEVFDGTVSAAERGAVYGPGRVTVS